MACESDVGDGEGEFLTAMEIVLVFVVGDVSESREDRNSSVTHYRRADQSFPSPLLGWFNLLFERAEETPSCFPPLSNKHNLLPSPFLLPPLGAFPISPDLTFGSTSACLSVCLRRRCRHQNVFISID